MAAFKFLLIASFYRFLIEKCNCTADKRLNWHWYLPTAWSSVWTKMWLSQKGKWNNYSTHLGLAKKGHEIIIVIHILAWLEKDTK